MALQSEDVLHCILDARKRGADTAKLAELYGCLLKYPDLTMLKDHSHRIRQVITGLYKEEQYTAKEVRYWVDNTDGIFSTKDCYQALNITSREAKKAVVTILSRLQSENIIEKTGDRNGTYRLVPNNREEDMDYINANEDNHIVFEFPLHVEQKTRIYPRSVIVVAGVTGTGKTTFILDWIFHNQKQHKITLFNSEMSAEAMKFKLSQYTDIGIKDWSFRMRRWRGRTDEIDPNGVTVIDYLSAPPDKPYLIKEPIDRIMQRLETGVVVIAMQKRQGADYGVGGVWSAMDTTLNIGLEFGRLEITKNRFREVDMYLGRDMRSFDVRHGHIVSTSGWYGDVSDDDRQQRRKRERKGDSGYTLGGKKRVPPERTREPGDDSDFEHEE